MHQRFLSTGIDATRRKLRIEALEAARQKAEDLAAVVGATVGDAVWVSEFPPGMERYDSGSSAISIDPSSLGRPEGISVTVKIYARFELK